MHLPDHRLNPNVIVLTATVAVAAIVTSCLKMRKDSRTNDAASHSFPFPMIGSATPALLAALAGLVFALQMLNYPISNETSGHVLGGLMVALVVGPWRATLVMSIVLAIQAVLFGDGGLYALGANITNMAIVGVWSGWGVFKLANQLSAPQSNAMRLATTAFVGWFSVQVAAFACVSELLLSSETSPTALLTKIWNTHALIGIGEATLTAACASIVLSIRARNIGSENTNSFPRGLKIASLAIFATALGALAISPWKSSLDDGLEWTLSQCNIQAITGSVTPTLSWQLADYQVPSWGETLPSLWFAALIGMMCVMFSTWFVQKSLQVAKVRSK